MKPWRTPKPLVLFCAIAASSCGQAVKSPAVGSSGCPSDMVHVPGGTFLMGSPTGVGDENEHPQHRVTLSGYCIDRTEVTVAAYARCVASGKCTVAPAPSGEREAFVSWFEAASRELSGLPEPEPAKEGFDSLCNGKRGDRKDHPVNCVDWEQATAYCAFVNRRLPSEAEWEYAARGSDGRTYPWGNEVPSAKRLNACGSECSALGKRLDAEWAEMDRITCASLVLPPDLCHLSHFKMHLADQSRQNGARAPGTMYQDNDGRETTAPVGSSPRGASPFGAQDMAGNVWEWTADWYGGYPAYASTNPSGADYGGARVFRGGGWYSNDAAWVRAAVRNGHFAVLGSPDLGFRCARGDAKAMAEAQKAAQAREAAAAKEAADAKAADEKCAAEERKAAAAAKPAADAKKVVAETGVASSGCPSDMVHVPGGTFLMGTPACVGDADEHPRHQVTLSGYCIDRTEVTVAAYARCVASGKCTVAFEPAKDGFDSWCNGTRGDRQDHPVNCVDWNQAAAYCAFVNRRLPSEAEWEYAARGSDGRRYPWGNEAPSAKRLNACGSECRAALSKREAGVRWEEMYKDNDGWEATAPVGRFPEGASPFGAQDMAGNVSEWAADWYSDYAAGVSTNPHGAKDGSDRMVRGGGWYNSIVGTVRGANRDWDVPEYRRSDLGFRCARGD